MSCHWTLLHIQWPWWPLTQLLIGFFALMWLGELTNPDNKTIHNPSKITKQTSGKINHDSFQFFLPGHKADKLFEGNTIMLMKPTSEHRINTFQHFTAYLQSQDEAFLYSLLLWLCSNGTVSTCSFFLSQLRLFFNKNITSQSMHAGGTTALAESGTPPSPIQAISHWSPKSFHVYVCLKKPCLNSSFTSCLFQPAWLLCDIK